MKKTYKPSKIEVAICKEILKQTGNPLLVEWLMMQKVEIATSLGMELHPYCSDRFYDYNTRMKVARSQATMFLYGYFVKKHAYQ